MKRSWVIYIGVHSYCVQRKSSRARMKFDIRLAESVFGIWRCIMIIVHHLQHPCLAVFSGWNERARKVIPEQHSHGSQYTKEI